MSVVRISSHLVRGLSTFLYSSEVFFRQVGHYQWDWILKNEGREGETERGREGGGKGGRGMERRMVKHHCQLPSL